MVSPFVCIFCQKTGPNLERYLTTKDIGHSVSPEIPPPPPEETFGAKAESLVEILRREMVTRRQNPDANSDKVKKAPAVGGGKEPKPKEKATKKKKAVAKPKQVKKKVKKKAKPTKSKRMGTGTKIQGATLAEALQGLATAYEKENFKILDPMLATVEPIEVTDQPQVAKLSHGLDRVLFNPGIHHLQDPRSRVYNFDPYLQNIMPVTEFDFEAVASYITSSEDKRLEVLAKKSGKKYVGSTSSMTSVLSQFHYLLSKWRGINTSTLSKSFPVEYKTFTALSRAPAAIFLRHKGEGTYAIDSDKEYDTDSILSLLGRSMEKLLTLPPSAYETTYRRGNSQAPGTSQNLGIDSYHFSTLGDFLMRSQLDAHDPRLPGTGMFDLKTRAVVSVRMDVQNFHLGSGYQIKSRTGEWESFEREYYDMIRAAFLKYSLQVRMGRMDGIFVAFHNTEKIFGFQYISLDEMDSALHEKWGSGIGDQEFKLSLQLLNQVLDKAVEKYPQQSLRLHFETRESLKTPMYVFAEPMAEEEIKDIQQRNKRNLADFLKSLEEKMQRSKRKAESKAVAARFGPVEEDEDGDTEEYEQKAAEPKPQCEEGVTGGDSAEAMEATSMNTADGMDGTGHTSATSEVKSDLDQGLEMTDSSATIEGGMDGAGHTSAASEIESDRDQGLEAADSSTTIERGMDGAGHTFATSEIESDKDQGLEAADSSATIEGSMDGAGHTSAASEIESDKDQGLEAADSSTTIERGMDGAGHTLATSEVESDRDQDLEVADSSTTIERGMDGAGHTLAASEVESGKDQGLEAADSSATIEGSMDGAGHTLAASEVESDKDQGLETEDSSATIEGVNGGAFGKTALDSVQNDLQEFTGDGKEELPETTALDDVQVSESSKEEESLFEAIISRDTQEVAEEAGAEEESPETTVLGDTAEDADGSTEESDTEGAEESETGMDGDQEYPEAEEVADTVELTDGSGRVRAPTEVLGLTLTVQNYFNGKAVERPGVLLPNDRWTVGYILEEAKTQKAAQITYSALKARRKRAVENRMLAEDSDEVNGYIRYLRLLSVKGREWADEQAREIKSEPVVYKGGDEDR